VGSRPDAFSGRRRAAFGLTCRYRFNCDGASRGKRNLSRKTAFDVRKETTALVTSGVFRFTRNPVYLSMVLLVIGVGLALNSLWSLVLAIPTGSALCLTAIKPEERYLDARFGDAYRAYRATVPRWFSVSRALSAL
jgi:protein-S-isoprenylcysteine O-methyltransferase Ste14